MSPDFTEVMRQSLLIQENRDHPDHDPARWALLPGLCCQAAGGAAGWADEVAAAWYLFFIAAHVFDNVIDQDRPEAWWKAWGPGYALNVASGLMFSALQILNALHAEGRTRPFAEQISADFYAAFLRMDSGQHRGLTSDQHPLTQWLEIAESKSGAFFALACRSGARLATNDAVRLEGFNEFGKHIGILIQVFDDLEDIKSTEDDQPQHFSREISRSLPVAYALDTYPVPLRDQLLASLKAAPESIEATNTLLDLLKEGGAELFILAEIERQKGMALAGLEKAKPISPAGEILASYLEKLANS